MNLRDYIKHMLTPGAKFDASAIDQIGGVLTSRAAVAGAFLVAVERRFERPPTREEVTVLVTKIREEYVDPDRLPPMLGEALVRAVFGEEHLAEDLSSEDLTHGQLLMTYGIIHDLEIKDDRFENFVSESARVAEGIIEQERSRPR